MVMHNTWLTVSILFGGAFFAGVSTVTDFILPPPVRPGIVVHSLTFEATKEGPFINQHRTVEAQNAIFAKWTAYVLLDGEPVCEGSGTWDYASGERDVPIPFDDWVGVPGCYDSLEIGVTYQAAAEYKWGDGESALQTSTGFMKE